MTQYAFETFQHTDSVAYHIGRTNEADPAERKWITWESRNGEHDVESVRFVEDHDAAIADIEGRKGASDLFAMPSKITGENTLAGQWKG